MNSPSAVFFPREPVRDARAWRLNLALYRRWLRRARRLLDQPPILWVYDPRLGPQLDDLPRELAVYHCTDDYAGMATRAQGSDVAPDGLPASAR